MSASTITIEVPPEIAEAYEKAPPEVRRRVEFLLNAKAREALGLPRRSVEEIMESATREAKDRGLTRETLQAIVDER